ncbi:unnamed protein product [Allacma fusca]|uniref:Uncharacterized protein n=1 Tax=Allacma fusca TaxID=39272 RepID=A0A8J2LBJ9_9HEXA|nr:unnamed protein product [Allacma fusca]
MKYSPGISSILVLVMALWLGNAALLQRGSSHDQLLDRTFSGDSMGSNLEGIQERSRRSPHGHRKHSSEDSGSSSSEESGDRSGECEDGSHHGRKGCGSSGTSNSTVAATTSASSGTSGTAAPTTTAAPAGGAPSAGGNATTSARPTSTTTAPAG